MAFVMAAMRLGSCLMMNHIASHLMRWRTCLLHAVMARHGRSYDSLQGERCDQQQQHVTDNKAHKADYSTLSVFRKPSFVAYTFPQQEGQEKYGVSCAITQQPCHTHPWLI
jgi:histidinol-phosphate/aromatic aminotransferase/cobyric acid decarboxylase-like protein